MPDDNSCLFHGLVHLLDPSKAPCALRQLVATEVRANPAMWDEATLGKPPKEYVDFILNPIRWGGQVELAILSSAFKAELAVIEVQSGRMDIYGEGSGYPRRVYLLHSGIHFDAISFGSMREVTTGMFSDADNAARQLAAQQRSAGNYVDQDTMRLRCKICGYIAVGDYQARAHAGGTGHKEFAPA
jgi:ubiquitin thioesterase OTU1